MTLIDSRPGIKSVYDELSRQTGVPIDSSLVVSRLGPPLESELANWFRDGHVNEMADRYRALYPELALPLIEPLSGAVDAIAAVRERGRAIVITAKNAHNALLHVKSLGFTSDDVYGGVWRLGKTDVLRAEGADMYIGDHIHDMDAATAADVLGVGVTTGPSSAADLREHGAAVVLGSLRELRGHLSKRRFRPRRP